MQGRQELETLMSNGVPEEALRFFGRWWQFETYLREVVYVELRARYGESYVSELGQNAADGVQRDQVNAYMASADSSDPLAYLDAGALMALIEKHWNLFEETLLPIDRWKADSKLLRTLRNRVSHCRRPHGDDLGRLLQLLRDLEHGARRFYGSYTSDTEPVPSSDPLSKAWVKARHRDADRILEHAERQYDTRFHLTLSRRPWAPSAPGRVSGKPGYLWHATWILGGREIRPTELWKRIAERPELGGRIVHLLLSSPFSAVATFASVDDAGETADAIGAIFDAVIETSHRMSGPGEPEGPAWGEAAGQLPRKVQTYGALSLFDPYAPPTIFAA